MDNINELKCEICEESFDFQSGNFSTHLKKHNISPKDYYVKYLLTEEERGSIFCKWCGKERMFLSIKKGFRNTCGDGECRKKSVSKSSSRSWADRMTPEGVENSIRALKMRVITEEERLATSKRFKGKKLSEEQKQKISKTRLERHFTWDEERKQDFSEYQKYKIANDEEYRSKLSNNISKAVEAARSDESKEKRKNSLIEKHGVTNSFQIPFVVDKLSITYSDEEKVKEITGKIKETKRLRYGDPNYCNPEKGMETKKKNNSHLGKKNIVVVFNNVTYYFRSSMEVAYFMLNQHLLYESIWIKYINIEGKQKTYILDFEDSVKKIIYEVKPSVFVKRGNNPLKMRSAFEWSKNNGYKFVLITETYFKHKRELLIIAKEWLINNIIDRTLFGKIILYTRFNHKERLAIIGKI